MSENRRYQEVMLQYRCALKALESRLEILNEEFSLQHDRNPIESMKSRLKSPSSIMIFTEVETELKECADSSREWDGKMERLLHLLT